MRARRLAVVIGLLAVAAVTTTVAFATPAQQKPITIGWAYDHRHTMKPFDTSAVAAAQLHLKTVNARGGARAQDRAQDLQHAGQQAGGGEVLCGEAARSGRRHHLHDL